MMTPAEKTLIRKLGQRVLAVEKGLKRATRTASLAYSSQEGGASEVYDDDGVLVVVTGDMGDGTFGVAVGDGTTAPVPVATTQDVAAQVAAIPTPTRSDIAPTTETPTNGAQWYQTEPDGVVIGWWIADGTTWVPQTITGVMLAADAIDGKTITGATLRTAATGERVVIRNDGSGGLVEAFSGVAGETPSVLDPSIGTYWTGPRPGVTLRSGTTPSPTADTPAQIIVLSGYSNGAVVSDEDKSAIFLASATVRVTGRLLGVYDAGEFNGNTDAAAQVTINHYLGVMPRAVSVIGHETYGTDRHRFTYDNVTATTFRVTVRNNTTGLVSSPTRFMWQAAR